MHRAYDYFHFAICAYLLFDSFRIIRIIITDEKIISCIGTYSIAYIIKWFIIFIATRDEA